MVENRNTMRYKRYHKRHPKGPNHSSASSADIFSNKDIFTLENEYLQTIKEDLETGDLPLEMGEKFLTVNSQDMAKLLHEYQVVKDQSLKSEGCYHRFGLNIKARDEYIQIDYMLYTKNQGQKSLTCIATSDYKITPLELELLIYLKSHRRSNYFSRGAEYDPVYPVIWFSDKGDCKEQFIYHEFCTASELAILFDKFEYYRYSTEAGKGFTR